jgi:hypothetical protein
MKTLLLISFLSLTSTSWSASQCASKIKDSVESFHLLNVESPNNSGMSYSIKFKPTNVTPSNGIGADYIDTSKVVIQYKQAYTSYYAYEIESLSDCAITKIELTDLD